MVKASFYFLDWKNGVMVQYDSQACLLLMLLIPPFVIQFTWAKCVARQAAGMFVKKSRLQWFFKLFFGPLQSETRASGGSLYTNSNFVFSFAEFAEHKYS